MSVGIPAALDSVCLRQRTSLVRRLRRAWLAYLLILPAITLAAIFLYYPSFSALYHSFFDWDGYTAPLFIGLSNFVALWNDPLMQGAIINVMKLTFFNVLIAVTVPLGTARLINALRSRALQYAVRICFIVPMVVPSVVIYLMWQFIYEPDIGVLNQTLRALGLSSLAQAWLGDPNIALYAIVFVGFPWVDGFGLLIYTAGLQAISQEVTEAARIDGASGLQSFLRVEVPLIVGQIKLMTILAIVNSIQGFAAILILTQGGPANATMVPGLVMYRSAFYDERVGYASAIGTSMFLVILALTILNLRYVRSSVEYEAPKR